MAYLVKPLQQHCKGFDIVVAPTNTQVGSGALPVALLRSTALKITFSDRRGSGKALTNLAKAFRELSIPVIGRITKDSLCFDIRCLEDESSFVKNLQGLQLS